MILQIGALFRSWLKSEPLFLSINVEFNFSGSNVNVGICGTQKGLLRMRGVFMSSCMSSTTKSIGMKKFHIFYWNILSDSYRVADVDGH
jgi:hypothetical protein